VEYSDRGGKMAARVPAKTYMQTIQVQTAGGNPVWLEAALGSDGYTVVNFEQIARWNPDKIFVVVWYALDPVKTIRDLKADPQWSSLKAVANGQIYAFPCDVFNWDTPELRWILGMNWLATRIHPERFRDIDMKAEVMAFFSQLYGMDKAAIEKVVLPKVKMDVR
jgi:iron complex transport system substrate-binding protein